MKKYIVLFLAWIAMLDLSSQDMSVYAHLVDKTWLAEGKWADGSKFKQEITFNYSLDSTVIVAKSMGYVDKEQTQWGNRNYGIRRWDAKKNSYVFTEYDVFGGVTEGKMWMDGKDIFYQYSYGEGKEKNTVTDAWFYNDKYSYNFQVGSFVDGRWESIYLKSKFHSLPIFDGPREDLDEILTQARRFSDYYMDEDHKGVASMYTENGVIMPGGRPIIKGHEKISDYWTVGEGVDVLNHVVIPERIMIEGDMAMDYGYYYGKSKSATDKEYSFKGKYLIVWVKKEGKWLIEADIWNKVE